MAVAYVQSKQVGTATTAAPTITFTANVTAGNLIALYTNWNSSTVAISSVADGLSNTYTAGTTQTSESGSPERAIMYYAKNINGGSCTITVTFASAVTSDIIVAEISGCDTTAPLDQNSSNFQASPATTTDAVTSGTAVTLAQSNEYCFAVSADTGAGSAINTGTANSPTSRENGLSGQGTWRYEEYTTIASGSFQATWTASAAGLRTHSHLMTFKAASAGGRGLFRTPPLSGVGIGASFFRDPLQGAGA